MGSESELLTARLQKFLVKIEIQSHMDRKTGLYGCHFQYTKEYSSNLTIRENRDQLTGRIRPCPIGIRSFKTIH